MRYGQNTFTRTCELLAALTIVGGCGDPADGGFTASGGSAASISSASGGSAEASTTDPAGSTGGDQSSSSSGPGPVSATDPPTSAGETSGPGPDTSAGAETGSSDSSGGGESGTTGVVPGSTLDASDYPSIQAAIDALEGVGGAVYIPAGEHQIPEKLRVHANITVFGAGMDVTVIRLEDGAPVDHLMGNDSSTGLENIVIRDLTLQGPGPSDGINACCYGLKLEHLKNSLVANVAARDHGRDGFYIGYKTKNDVPEGVFDTRLSGIVATGNGRNGLSIVQGQNILVDGGTFNNNNTNEAVAAIDLEPDPGRTSFVRQCRIVGNTVSNNFNNGIQMYAEGGAIVADNAICHNTISDNSGTGIADHQADNDVFVGNMFSNNGADADYDGSALVGDEYAAACGLPLPGLPPLPALPP
jgi:parallel beta-helix repeat protein